MLASLEKWMSHHGDQLQVHIDDDEDLRWVGKKGTGKDRHSEWPLARGMHPEAAELLVQAIKEKFGKK